MKFVKGIFILFALILASGSYSHAQLYGAGNTGSDGLSTFYHIDPNTGNSTVIGGVGFERCGSMDAHPVTNQLYALCERADGSDTGVLVMIDQATGAGTEVGPTGISGDISDISFRNSDSVLFAENVANDPEHTLFTININTGQATLVGDTGLSGTSGNGLSFNLIDTLFLQTTNVVPELYVMNQNGLATFSTNVTFPPPDDFTRFKALDVNPGNGAMYGVYTSGDGGGGPTFLAILNTNTGSVTQLGAVVDNMDALAFADAPISNVPTLSEWGLIAMVALLGIAGFMVIRRRQATA